MVVANIMGTDGIIVLIIVLVVVFGSTQLPKIARNVGSAGKEFRKAQDEAEREAKAEEAAKAVNATEAPAVTATSEDKVTLSKSELNALLDERESRAKGSQTNN